MSSTSAKLLVFTSSQLACVKIQGKANFVTSSAFKALFTQFISGGYNCIVLDASECEMMDSTFLGILAGYSLKLAKPAEDGSEKSPGIELLNPTREILESINSIGVLHLFRVIQANSAGVGIENGEFTENVCHAKPSREEVTLNCLEAHKLLMEINPNNVAKFKDVTEFLAEDLKRIQAVK